MASAAFVLAVFVSAVAGAASTTWAYDDNLPNKSEPGQSGTNHCGTGSAKDSKCQNAIINDVDDFCLFGPPGTNQSIGAIERVGLAYCVKSGYGTRVFPDGTIKGAHYVKTPEYIQITGWGDFTKIGVKKGDAGGELDPHGADGKGNPIGGLVFGDGYGNMEQFPEWTNFMSATEFCIRVCNPRSPNATKYCAHRYDIMGCAWNMPGNYAQGVFESCNGDSGEPMGIYTTTLKVTNKIPYQTTTKTTSRSTSRKGKSTRVIVRTITRTVTRTSTVVSSKPTLLTWRQGMAGVATPKPHPAPAKSQCVRVNSITSGALVPSAARVTTSFTTVQGTKSDLTYAATFTVADDARRRRAATGAPGPLRTAF